MLHLSILCPTALARSNASFLSLLSSSPPIPYAVHVCMYVYVRPFLMRLVLFSEGEIENQFFGGPEPFLARARGAASDI